VNFAWNAVTTFGAGGESSDLSAAGTMEQNITRIAADLAQFARLKVSWADIQEAIIEYLKLYGTMTVYTDSALTTEGGKLGYTTGNLDLPMQIGMILASALLRGVAIVSDEGSYLGYKGDSDYTVDYTMDGQGNVDISDILYGRRLRLTDSGADLRGGARLEQSDIPPEGEVPLAYPHAPSGDVNIMPGGNGEVTVAGFPLASSEQIVTGTGELGDPIVLTEALVRNWVYPSELYYAGGDTYGETFLVPHAGVITTGSTALWLSVPVDKSLENVSSISVTSLIGGARIASGGYVNGYGDSTEWVGQTGLTFTAAKAGDRLVTVRVDSATDYTDGTNPVTNNTPITLVGRITLAFT